MSKIQSVRNLLNMNEVKTVLRTRPADNRAIMQLKDDVLFMQKIPFRPQLVTSETDKKEYITNFLKSYIGDAYSQKSRFNIYNQIRKRIAMFISKLTEAMYLFTPQHTEVIKDNAGKIVGGFSVIRGKNEMHVASLFFDKNTMKGKMPLLIMKRIKRLAELNEIKLLTCDTDLTKKDTIKLLKKTGFAKKGGIFLKRLECKTEDFAKRYIK